jgi:hypothetical protein
MAGKNVWRKVSCRLPRVCVSVGRVFDTRHIYFLNPFKNLNTLYTIIPQQLNSTEEGVVVEKLKD